LVFHRRKEPLQSTPRESGNIDRTSGLFTAYEKCGLAFSEVGESRKISTSNATLTPFPQHPLRYFPTTSGVNSEQFLALKRSLARRLQPAGALRWSQSQMQIVANGEVCLDETIHLFRLRGRKIRPVAKDHLK